MADRNYYMRVCLCVCLCKRLVSHTPMRDSVVFFLNFRLPFEFILILFFYRKGETLKFFQHAFFRQFSFSLVNGRISISAQMMLWTWKCVNCNEIDHQSRETRLRVCVCLCRNSVHTNWTAFLNIRIINIWFASFFFCMYFFRIFLSFLLYIKLNFNPYK